jgi:hypothetical protein
MGDFSVAMAFAYLEVVLDRGQTEDWFESNFIVGFFAVAMVALVFAIIWEWRHPDPVVEIRLLVDRNFALANIFYFIVGFTLFLFALRVDGTFDNIHASAMRRYTIRIKAPHGEKLIPRRFLSQSFRFPRKTRGSDRHTSRGRLSRAPVVSIAMIRGRATGNGSELALACDMSRTGEIFSSVPNPATRGFKSGGR